MSKLWFKWLLKLQKGKMTFLVGIHCSCKSLRAKGSEKHRYAYVKLLAKNFNLVIKLVYPELKFVLRGHVKLTPTHTPVQQQIDEQQHSNNLNFLKRPGRWRLSIQCRLLNKTMQIQNSKSIHPFSKIFHPLL